MHSPYLLILFLILPILLLLVHPSSQTEITKASPLQSNDPQSKGHLKKYHNQNMMDRAVWKKESTNQAHMEHRKHPTKSRKTLKASRTAREKPSKNEATTATETNPVNVDGLTANKSQPVAETHADKRFTNDTTVGNNKVALGDNPNVDMAIKSRPELVCFLNGDQLDWVQILDFISTRRANSTPRPRQRQRPSTFYTGKGQPNLVYPKYHKFHTQADTYDDDYHNNNNHRTNNKATSYWLVPPFLIGALSICFAYVAIHCIYNHCHCGDKHSTSNTPAVPPHRRPLPNGIDHHHHPHKEKKRVRRVHLVNASMPPNGPHLRGDVRIRQGPQMQGGPGADGANSQNISSETQTTTQSIVSSNRCNTATTTTSPAPPDLMPMIVFNNNDDNNQEETTQNNNNNTATIRPHMQLQHLNSSPAYGFSTSTFAYEDTLNSDNRQRRYSHLVPIINYSQPSPDVQANDDPNQYFESRPFLLVESGNDMDNYDDDDDDYYDENDEDDDRDAKMLGVPEKQPRRRSALLKISDAIGRRLSQTRLSFSSASGFSQQNRDEESAQLAQRKVSQRAQQPRASLCFFPVARTVSDPSCGVMQVVMPPPSPIFLDPLLNPNISPTSLGHQMQQPLQQQQSREQQPQQPPANVPIVVVTGASDSSLNEMSTRSLENHSLEAVTTTTTTISTSMTTSTNPTTYTTTTTTTTTTNKASTISLTSNSSPISSPTTTTTTITFDS